MNMVIGDLHRMAEQEIICTISSWTRMLEQEHLMLCTTRGFVRAFPMAIMRDNIEAPVPLKLDHPLPGLPLFVGGAQSLDEVILTTAHGRGLRWPVNALRITGTQVANCGKDDRIVSAALAQPDDELLLLTNDGFARRLRAGWISIPEKPNQKGKSLLARRSLAVAFAKPEDWAITDKNLLSIRSDTLRLEDSTKSRPVVVLEQNEYIRGTLSVP
jgi:DNA gyrase/topoisomerase IV subunit A